MHSEARVQSYADLFELRGTSYDQAMQVWPHARHQEFEQMLQMIPFHDGMVVADVPAGGGYLQRYLPTGCIWLGHEPCATFSDHHASAKGVLGQALLPLPWQNERVDIMVSLAGVHHQADKRPLFADMHRVTREGGFFILSDVAAHSPVAHFLDEFVGSHNSTGHDGIYLDESTAKDLEATGWKIRSDKRARFHWMFQTVQDMTEFCRKLFDIRSASDAEIYDAVEDHLGVDVMEPKQAGGDMIGMRWELRTILAERMA